jgi:hypothetical protein
MSKIKPFHNLSILSLGLVLIILGGCCNCLIGWQPDALRPIFYGHKDYSSPIAPGPVRIFYPSVDGSPSGAPIQEDCCKYPLIILIHGHCSESEHYKKWFLQAAHLARNGFVVAVPEIPSIASHPSNSPHPGLTRIGEIRQWVLNDWEHHELVHPNTGIAGHSFGALHGARFAQGNSQVKAYASLSGVWEDWPTGPLPVLSLNIPTMFIRGNDPFGDMFTGIDHFWGSLQQPKHRVLFEGGYHWDYLLAGASTCESTVGGRGECSSTPILSSELLAMFFERYLSRGSSVDSRIPPSLIPPALTLTSEQQFFAGGNYLNNLKTTSCEISITWNTADGSGTENFP